MELDELIRETSAPDEHAAQVVEGVLAKIKADGRYAKVDGQPALWGPLIGAEHLELGDELVLAQTQDGTPFVVWPAAGGGGSVSWPPGGSAGEVLGWVGPDPDDVDWVLGTPGPQGPAGPAGPGGPQGPKGDTGAASTVPGPTGPQGPQGATGTTGATGPKGDAGSQGPAGQTGAQGPQGPQGEQGVDWRGDYDDEATYNTGDAIYDSTNRSSWIATLDDAVYPDQFDLLARGGDDGSRGDQWLTGSGAPAAGLGLTGDWYVNSANGDYYEKTGASGWVLRGNLRGPQGAQGAQGAQGPQGVKGDTGTAGATGAQGPQGPQGVKGDTGAQGPAGGAAPVVTTLPSSPADGTEVLYRFAQNVAPVDATPRLWHLRYDAAAALWLPVGAQEPVMAYEPTARGPVAIGVNTWSTGMAPGIALNVPLVGTYRFCFGAGRIWKDGTVGSLYIGLVVGAGFPTANPNPPTERAIAIPYGTSTFGSGTATHRRAAAPGVSHAHGQFSSVAGNVFASERFIEANPITIDPV